MVTDTRTREGARIIAALEQLWAEIRTRHTGVPDAVLITGTGLPKAGSKAKRAVYQKLGHLHPDRWLDADREQRRAELFVAGELLDAGGEAVLETLLHEAAHGLAVRRGIRDCSSDGKRWHNREFAKLAREVGLQPPPRAAKVIGYSESLILPETTKAYAAALKRLQAARLPFLEGGAGAVGAQAAEGEGEESGGKGGRAGKRAAVECACEPPRRFQLTAKILEEGDLICGRCEQKFAPVDPEAFPPSKRKKREPEHQEQAEAGPGPVEPSGPAVPAARSGAEAELDWQMEEPPPEEAEEPVG
ncbi:hypothetical protein ACFC26_41365 [Kitasatospora purpeofusca]|uniref:hypothetical protein n=1 Tax=Kitasatospora purpeofusca TaxID=67352 RepID=UPI0035E0A7DB